MRFLDSFIRGFCKRGMKLQILAFYVFLVSFACCLEGVYDPIAVYLTWQRSPESTMTISWISTVERTEDLIEFHAEDETAWKSTMGAHVSMPLGAPYLIHKVELTNLQPAKNYYFRTGSDATVYKFQTMPAVLTGSINFVVGGDMYHDGIEYLHETNLQAAKTGPLFALVGGDIAYAADQSFKFLPRWAHGWIDRMVGQKVDRWLEWLIAWKNDMVTPDGRLVPMLPVLGNHDTNGGFSQTPKEAPFFYALFAMPGPQGYNVLDFGNYMSLVLLDSGHTHPIRGEQAKWLDATLAERQNIAHKIALYHVPAFPSVRKLNDEHCASVRNNWVPIFEKYHLAAAFEHHDHAYKRTYPIKDNHIDRQGVMYFGDGAWGVDKPRNARRVVEKWYLANFASARHFIHVVLYGDRMQVTAINSQGTVLDSIEW